jgi:hypothetical protein
MRFSWRTDNVEFDGPFGWRGIDLQKLFYDVIPKLHNFESQMWGEVEGDNSHFVDVDALCAEAKSRLNEINKDHLERLFSLRLTGKQRVWGYREGAILMVLWWDPEHAVGPSYNKNT